MAVLSVCGHHLLQQQHHGSSADHLHHHRGDRPAAWPTTTAQPCCHVVSRQHRQAVAPMAVAAGHDAPLLAGQGCGSPPGGSGHHHHHQQPRHQHQQPQPPPQQQQPRHSSGCSAAGWPLAACAAAADADVTPCLGWNAGFHASYRLGEVMARGSFGTVHRAVSRATGISYAVKVLPKHCGVRGTQLEAIRREVGTWQQAQRSKFVARLEGLYEDEERAYIVQELCAGGSLRERLAARGACSEHEAAAVMRGVLDLLVECHRRSICYGDLKPANIMFSGGGGGQQQQQPQQPLQVRAIDFGCSHSAKGRALTQACGSPLYMAPEVALQRYGVAVDVWSAGVMLYQMLTGRLPFWPAKTLDEVARLPCYAVVAAIRTHEVAFPRALWGHISPAAQDLVARMLDRNPASRITAAQALEHPWLRELLGFTPTPSGDEAAAGAGGGSNNVVPLQRGAAAAPAARPLHAGGPAAAPAPAPGPLSPQRSSPLRAMLSGDLPASMLVADLHRAPATPVAVPAAE